MDLRNTYISEDVESHYLVDLLMGEFQTGIEPWMRMLRQLLGISGFTIRGNAKVDGARYTKQI